MEKLKIPGVVVTEGQYDAARLRDIIDGIIVTTDGYRIFKDPGKRQLIKRLGEGGGVVIITDSDYAGFKIRNYVSDFCQGLKVTHVYTPLIPGKERRKTRPSKEGFLGVEGISESEIREAFHSAGFGEGRQKVPFAGLTYADLYELGLSGRQGSGENRRKVCDFLGIPDRLSKKSFLEALNRMTDREEIQRIIRGKPALFFDFHGTLTYPDNQWLDISCRLCDEFYPELEISHEKIRKNLIGKCLPWFTMPDRDTRNLVENDGWWRSCNRELAKMYINSGLTPRQARALVPHIRPYITDPSSHRLYPDTIFVLDELQRRGYKNYIISNNFPELPRVISRLGLDKYFDGCFVSALVGYAKPRKELFDFASRKAGRGEKIMIGDNLRDDIFGAKACGFETVLVNKPKDQKSPACDYVAENLTALLDILP